MTIVTIYNDKTGCLSKKAAPIPSTPEGLVEAQNITQQLLQTIIPLMPAAGLAAPQIGISKQIFIYSWDRTLEHMEVVINPKIIEYGKNTYLSWEACFSTIQNDDTSQAVQLSRAKSLIVRYTNIEGKMVKQRLNGFAAKAFQHEYDHLQGVVNTQTNGAELKSFANKEELIAFMDKVKKNDSTSYIQPIQM